MRTYFLLPFKHLFYLLPNQTSPFTAAFKHYVSMMYSTLCWKSSSVLVLFLVDSSVFFCPRHVYVWCICCSRLSTVCQYSQSPVWNITLDPGLKTSLVWTCVEWIWGCCVCYALKHYTLKKNISCWTPSFIPVLFFTTLHKNVPKVWKTAAAAVDSCRSLILVVVSQWWA